MTAAELVLPAGAPPWLPEALAAVERRTGEMPRVAEHWWGKRVWVALTPGYAVYLAGDDAGRQRLPLEERRVRWAASQGIPVPEVVELGEGWLISRRVPRGDQVGPRFVEAVTAAAHLVATAGPPPPEVLAGGRARRAPRHTIALRLARMAASPLSVRLFMDSRRVAAGLAADTLAHGDFIPSNLPFDEERGRVHLVDWEMLGYAPAHTDLLTLWPHLARAEDRQALLETALRRSGDRRALAALHRWLTVRALADLTNAPRRQWNRPRVETVTARVREAVANAAAWGG